MTITLTSWAIKDPPSHETKWCSPTCVLFKSFADQFTLCRICFSPGDCCNDNPKPVICRTQFPNGAAVCTCSSLRRLGVTLSPLTFSEHLCLCFWSTLQLHHVAIISASQRWWLKLKGFTLIIYQHKHTHTHSATLGGRFSASWVLRRVLRLCHFWSFNCRYLFFQLISIPYSSACTGLHAVTHSYSYRQHRVLVYDDTLRFTWQLSARKWGPCSEHPQAFLYVTGFSKGAKVKHEWLESYWKTQSSSWGKTLEGF